ncbi:MAG TPA: lipopolysaccharide assembly protein LapA domain-containing protein [Ktedonobacteraceae bacterium]
MLVVILVIFVLAGGALVVLAFENATTLTIEVHVKVFGWHTPALPLGVLLLLAFLSGALLLYIVTVLSAWKDRRQLARLRRRVAELEQAQANTYSYPQQYSPSIRIPMPGVHVREHTPPSWLNS